MPKRKTDKEFKKEVLDLVGDEYEFLDTYVNAKTKLRVEHNKCGNIYTVTPSNFLSGSRCPYCDVGGVDRKTDVEFKKEVFDLVGKEYVFLDSYVNRGTKLRVKHNKCGNVYKVTPANFIRGTRCPHCNGNAKKTNKQFKWEVFNLVGNEYTFLDDYTNAKTKIRVKHNKCGNVYKVKPHNFLIGKRCPYCYAEARGGVRRKTNIQFKWEAKNLVGDEYTFLDTYVNSHTKIRVKHNKCGNIYCVAPTDFISKQTRCPYCFGTPKKTDIQFKQEVLDLVGDEYTFLDSYVNSKTQLRVKHNKCGNTYEVKPSNFLSGKRCPYCFGTPKKTDTQFKQEVKNLVGSEYVFLDAYVNSHTKLRVKHNKCGYIYRVAPNSFIQGTRCPHCNNSKGETIISKVLDTLDIKFEYQKYFDDLKDTQPLSYDFYIPDQGILIEYQGIQHYQPIDHFGGDDRFKYQQKHDKMKAEYAKSHNYNLIAVPYTEDTFSKIKKYLLKHGLKRH